VNYPIRQTILDSCFTRILLPNPSAKNDDLKELYKGNLGLNNKQIDIIANAVMKQHYYYSAPNSRNNRLFDLGLAPVALSFVGATSKDDIKTVRKLQAEHGDLWVKYWLSQRDLGSWGDLWEERYLESQKRDKD
jgi:type IV secretion system protein VirB4